MLSASVMLAYLREESYLNITCVTWIIVKYVHGYVQRLRNLLFSALTGRFVHTAVAVPRDRRQPDVTETTCIYSQIEVTER